MKIASQTNRIMQDYSEQEQIIWEKELDDYVRQVHFIFEGQYVLATTSAGSVYAFSKSGLSRLFRRELHIGAIIGSDISQKNSLLATGGEDGKFLITNLHTGEINYQFEEPGKWIEHVTFNPGGDFVAFSCVKKVYIVAVNGGLYDTITKAENTISSLAWHQDGEMLAIGCFGGVDLYNLETMELYQHLPWKNAVVSLTISPDKQYVCSGTQDYQVHIWPLPYTAGSDMAMSGFPAKVKCLDWHYEGLFLATNSGSEVVVWDFGGKGPGNKVPDMLKGHHANVTTLAFQHNNDILASCDDGGILLFFCPKISSHAYFKVILPQSITAISWSPDDKLLGLGTVEGLLFMIESPIESE